jgi:hypothetical protein
MVEILAVLSHDSRAPVLYRRMREVGLTERGAIWKVRPFANVPEI